VPVVERSRPLEGIRVFDWTIYGVGPFAGVMLGALGADVIKVEQPGGDPQLRDETRQGGMSTMYINQNLCKRSVVLDLKQEADRARAIELLATCDVFLNNMRPGTPERSGLGYAAVRRIAPQIVYCVATGWGSTGPMADVGGVDLLAQAFSGVAGITGPPGGDAELYRQLGNLDYSTSSYIVAAVLEALYARARSGRGAEISLSLLEAAVSVQATRLVELLLAGAAAPRLGSSTTTNAPDGAFRTADSKFLTVSVVSDAQWQRLCVALERPDLGERSDLATNAGRVQLRGELERTLAPVFGGAHSVWWSLQLARNRVPHAIASDFAALRDHAQVRANGYLVEVPTRWGNVLTGAPPWTFSDARVELFAAPLPGEDTESVFQGLAEDEPKASSDVPGGPDLGAPYAGVRVLDLSSGIAGPYCTHLLARGGASVVKLERPEGDHLRAWEPQTLAGDSAAYAFVNGGKTIVRAASDREYESIAVAPEDPFDVVVVDVAGGRGPSATRLRRLNERVIVCAVSGYGERGPLAGIPASELTCQALAAVPAGLGRIGEAPVRIGADIASTVAGVHAFQAITAALIVRERSGLGQRVGVSPLRSMIFLKSFHWGALGNPDSWGVTHIHQSWTRQPNHGYRTADGRVAFVWYRGDPESFRAFLDEVGLTERVRDDARFAAGARPTSALGTHGDSCVEIYESAFAHMTTAEAISALERAGAYAVPVLDHTDLVAHPQFVALELLEPGHDGSDPRLPRRPWRTSHGSSAPVAQHASATERSGT
jgi:crotonobetainyl-CoA:carnitine CoA-transferase CaiB-like acyl-CoA transferase